MEQGTDRALLDEAMPNGWILQETDDPNRLNIINEYDATEVGHLVVMADKALFSVAETNPFGKKFWQDFAMKHEKYSPYGLRYGVLYADGGTGHIYELDEMPTPLSMTPPRETLQRYEHTKAFYVLFKLGNWHPFEKLLKVNTAQRILLGGFLDHTTLKNHTFNLGEMENEGSM
jgi:hypothetical protein